MAITGSDLIDAIIDLADPIPRKPWYRMYECITCRETFSAEYVNRKTEPHGEVLLYCPYCGSGEVDDAPKKDPLEVTAEFGLPTGLGRRKQRRDK